VVGLEGGHTRVSRGVGIEKEDADGKGGCRGANGARVE
jgi:hypothetical protein